MTWQPSNTGVLALRSISRWVSLLRSTLTFKGVAAPMRDWRLLSAGSSGFPHRFTCKHLVCTSWRQVGTSFIPPTDVRVHLFATVGHLRDRVGRDEEHVSSGIRCFLEKVRIGCKGFFVSIGNTLILIAFDWYISWFRSCIQLWMVLRFGSRGDSGRVVKSPALVEYRQAFKDWCR